MPGDAREQIRCFEVLGAYRPNKYELRHGPGCGPDHKPGDPVRAQDKYFPLNVTSDPHARVALAAYIGSVLRVNPSLSFSLGCLLTDLGGVDPDRARRGAAALNRRADESEG